MRIPLYSHEQPHPANANAGLWFNKFCNTWNEGWTLNTQNDNSPKQVWINKFASHQGHKTLLKETLIRRQMLLSNCAGNVVTMKTRVAFVTGMGNPHPIENGFTWHHTLGVPYLPGSSIKGLVRDWAQNWLISAKNEHWNNEAEKNQTLLRLLGSEKKDGTKNNKVGSVIFLDALPLKPVKLKAEIMTPHYAEYYQDDEGLTAPGDWLNPTPIPFLAVDQDQLFQFAALPRRVDSETHIKDAKLATDWLQAALSTLGAGAKTATGYGQMEPDDDSGNFQTKLNTEISNEQEWRASTFRKVNESLQRSNFSASEKQLDELNKHFTRYQTEASNKTQLADELRKVINQILDNASHLNASERAKAKEQLSRIYHAPSLFNKKQRTKKLNELENLLGE